MNNEQPEQPELSKPSFKQNARRTGSGRTSLADAFLLLSVVSRMTGLEPKLLPNLRVALSNLYGLDNGNQPRPHSIEAHSYLIRFQSRNCRRKILSLQQRERDSVAQEKTNESVQDKILGSLGDDYGSTFFTCVAILSRPHLFNETERLFCAQTLLSRIRRMPTYQAVVSLGIATTIILRPVFLLIYFMYV